MNNYRVQWCLKISPLETGRSSITLLDTCTSVTSSPYSFPLPLCLWASSYNPRKDVPYIRQSLLNPITFDLFHQASSWHLPLHGIHGSNLALRVWSNEALCSLIDQILLLGGVCDIIRNHPVASWLWWDFQHVYICCWAMRVQVIGIWLHLAV